MEIHLPADFEQLGEYQLLQTRLGRAGAAWAFLRCAVRLAYSAQECGVGWLRGQHVELLRGQLNLDAGTDADAATAAFRALIDSGWLKEREDGALYCPRFEKDNGHLAPDYLPPHMKANAASLFARRQKRVEQQVAEQGLLIAPAVFTRPDGQPMNPAEARRCTMIVKWVDNATFRAADRQPSEFTEGVMQSAWRLGEQMNDDALKAACKLVSDRQQHPMLRGMPTETLLPQLPELVRMVER